MRIGALGSGVVGQTLAVKGAAAGRPAPFICGNDPGAKVLVSGMLDQFGWDTEDMGEVPASRRAP